MEKYLYTVYTILLLKPTCPEKGNSEWTMEEIFDQKFIQNNMGRAETLIDSDKEKAS